MGSRVDLHTHTTASDGALTPEQLVDLAAERGVEVLAVTDHDSTAGLDAAQAHAQGRVEVWPGVEISSDVPGFEVHVLGYFLDHHQPSLLETLAKLQESRLHRAERMVEKLAALGMRIRYERVRELAGTGAVGRPHVAQALLEAGYVSSFREAFDLYIGRNGPAYVERHKLTPEEAVRLIRAAGGLAVLAHPIFMGARDSSEPFDLRSYLVGLVREGLGGIEAYYPDYPTQYTQEMLGLARDFGLVPTGGSDFHGGGVTQTMLGGVEVPWTTVEAMRRWRARQGQPGS